MDMSNKSSCKTYQRAIVSIDSILLRHCWCTASHVVEYGLREPGFFGGSGNREIRRVLIQQKDICVTPCIAKACENTVLILEETIGDPKLALRHHFGARAIVGDGLRNTRLKTGLEGWLAGRYSAANPGNRGIFQPVLEERLATCPVRLAVNPHRKVAVRNIQRVTEASPCSDGLPLTHDINDA